MQPNKWEMKVRTDDDSFVCEITNGKISICVNDDGEEEDMQAIVDALNKAEVSFYSNNKLELDQHIEIMQLQDEGRQWKAKYDELKEIVKDFTFKFAELNQEHTALKEKAEKITDILESIFSDNHKNEDGTWETPIVISEHLMPYLEQALSSYNSSTTSKEGNP